MSGTNTGTVTVTMTATMVGDYGTAIVVQTNTGSATIPVFVTLTLRPPPPPPPPSTTDRGPQATISCPTGAIPITPGTDVQTIVNQYGPGTTFCFLAGVHPWHGSVTPKPGNSFTGEFGAVLDWSSAAPRTADNVEGFFVAHNQDIDDVTFRNLTLRNSPARGIVGSPPYNCDNTLRQCSYGTSGADRWTIDHVLIDHCQFYGVIPSNYVTLTNSIIRHCGETAQGGAYGSILIDHGLIENNEFSYYGHETKIHLSRNITLRGNWYHDSPHNGPWLDGENIDWLMENNLIEDVGGQGMEIEISGRGVMRNNIVRRSGDNAYYISTSHDVEVYGNRAEDSFRGINITAAGKADMNALALIGQPPNPDCGWVNTQCWADNISVHDNTILVPSVANVLASGFSFIDMTPAQVDAYTPARTFTFANNHYAVYDLNAAIWFWKAGLLNWTGWLAVPQDGGGTLVQR
jgi:hypothetical protein